MAIKKGTVLISAGDRRILKSFGHKVKEVRDKKKQSTYDLTGDDMPIKSRQHWQGVESGKKNINLTTLFKIAKSLGVKAKDLIDGLD